MIFRSKKSRDTATAVAGEDSEDPEELFGAIDALSQENREARDPDLERRILRARYRAGVQLTEHAGDGHAYPEPAFDRLSGDAPLPEVGPAELTPELLRAAILRSGCLLVRGLVDREQAAGLADDIERVFEAREAQRSGGPAPEGYYEPFDPGTPSKLFERDWVADAGGVWAADSPKVVCEMLDALERAGLRDVAAEYLGERPALSLQKCTLRKATAGDTETAVWHQDGAFLGEGVRALNVWLSLSRCGDVAPGLDVVPRRLDRIVPIGTEGAAFDWSVSQAEAEKAAGDVPIQRPIFEPGDVLLFDEMCLHSTATEPGMPNTRYAIESWFFSPSGFPSEYVPLAF